MSGYPTRPEGYLVMVDDEIVDPQQRFLNFKSPIAVTLNPSLNALDIEITGGGTVWSAEVANSFWAGPASGGPAAPSFRAIVAADIPASFVQIGTSAGPYVGGEMWFLRSPNTGIRQQQATPGMTCSLYFEAGDGADATDDDPGETGGLTTTAGGIGGAGSLTQAPGDGGVMLVRGGMAGGSGAGGASAYAGFGTSTGGPLWLDAGFGSEQVKSRSGMVLIGTFANTKGVVIGSAEGGAPSTCSIQNSTVPWSSGGSAIAVLDGGGSPQTWTGNNTFSANTTFPTAAAGFNRTVIPTIAGGSNTANGHVVPDVADDVFCLRGNAETLTALKTFTRGAFTGTTPASSNEGVNVSNTTASPGSGTQEWSPLSAWVGAAWSTGGGGTSVTQRAGLGLRPVQLAATPYNDLVLWSDLGSGYGEVVAFSAYDPWAGFAPAIKGNGHLYVSASSTVSLHTGTTAPNVWCQLREANSDFRVSAGGTIYTFDATALTALMFKTSTALVATGGGGSTASFAANSVGGTGQPATATQNAWLKALDSTGATVWIPVWK